MSHFNDNSYALLQGSLFMQRRALNGGVIGSLIPVGDADQLEIAVSQDFNDIKESQSGLRYTAAHIITGTDVKVKANLLIANQANLAASLWGTDTGVAIAGSVSAELKTAYNNSLVPLANPGVSAVVAVLGGSATHVAAIAVTAAGTGYAANTLFAMTLTTGVGQVATAISDANGRISGVYLTGTGTTLATAASITTPGGGTGATFAIQAGGASVVLSVDYTLDAVNGSLTVLPGSLKIPAYRDIRGIGPTTGGQVSVSVNYTFAEYQGRVEAFTRGISYYSLRLQGINVANDNQPIVCAIHQVALDMRKMLSLIDAKHQVMELDGMLLQDTTRALPTALAPFSQFFNITKA